jgi:hypothetical protein
MSMSVIIYMKHWNVETTYNLIWMEYLVGAQPMLVNDNQPRIIIPLDHHIMQRRKW